MERRSRLRGASKDIQSGKTLLTFEVDGGAVDLTEMEGDLRLTTKKWREKRSKDANALFWACVGELSAAIHRGKWDTYLMLLKDYGRYSYVIVPEGAVDKMREMWRETEVVGDIDVNGRKAVQMLCYYGSSTYDTKEMSHLIDGTIQEMEQVGLPRPDSGEIRRALEEWEKIQSSKRQSVASSADVQTS